MQAALEREVIKERRGAGKNMPTSKKEASRMSCVGGEREDGQGWCNWNHMGALAFCLFAGFLFLVADDAFGGHRRETGVPAM